MKHRGGINSAFFFFDAEKGDHRNENLLIFYFSTVRGAAIARGTLEGTRGMQWNRSPVGNLQNRARNRGEKTSRAKSPGS
jgi:hypothetical protein